MARILEREMEKLKKEIFELCAMVEENFKQAIRSVIDRDKPLAQKVIQDDDAIDSMEIEVEEECLKILALHQPVASDLRFIIAALKINNDLERIGDLAVNVAKRAIDLSHYEYIDVDVDFSYIYGQSISMLKKSIDAFISLDTCLSYQVCSDDDEVDQLNKKMYRLFKEIASKNPGKIDLMLQFLSISRYVERIADHATNIAQDVIYMANGNIIRHRKAK